MKHLVLKHYYQGQCLSHHWLHITAADAERFPHDHGYIVNLCDRWIGEVMVKERKCIPVSSITDMMARMICGYGKELLLKDLADRGITTAPDGKVFLFQFEWIKYLEGFNRFHKEAFDTNRTKHSTSNTNFQYAII